MVYLLSITTFGGLLVGLSAALIVSERFLVNYGECEIKVKQEDEEKQFAVQGGGYLLHALVDNGVNISASCAGKASCGYCKVRVLDGGGPILPTEEVFMSREEKISGIRLSCQVKVKNNIQIYVPDFLTTVRGIVKNKMYDPRLRWRFNLGGSRLAHELPGKREVLFTPEEEEKAHAIIESQGDGGTSLIPALQQINDTFNYLPKSVFPLISKTLAVPESLVYRIATFYNAFSLTPRGKYIIAVCLGTACHVKGAGNVMTTLESNLDIEEGHTTEDMLFTLESVRCIGCCGLAPVLKVNEDIHGLMTAGKVSKLVETYRKA